jgi:hypothetical protein
MANSSSSSSSNMMLSLSPHGGLQFHGINPTGQPAGYIYIQFWADSIRFLSHPRQQQQTSQQTRDLTWLDLTGRKLLWLVQTEIEFYKTVQRLSRRTAEKLNEFKGEKVDIYRCFY